MCLGIFTPARNGLALLCGDRAVDRWKDIARRACGGAGPITLEIARHVLDHWSDREHIQVDEHHVAAGFEVLVTNVSASHDGHLTVSRQRLVVHSAVHAREVTEVVDHSPATVPKRVEETHVDPAL